MAEEEEFLCRGINDYYASVSDELDVKEGHIYTIMQVSAIRICLYFLQHTKCVLNIHTDIAIRMVVRSE